MEPQPQFALSQDPAQHPSPSSSLTRSFLSCKSRTSSRPSTAHGLGALGKIPKDVRTRILATVDIVPNTCCPALLFPPHRLAVTPPRRDIPSESSFSRHILFMILTLRAFSKDAAAKLGNSAYADKPEPSSRRQSIDLFNMFSTTSGAAEERPTRKLKKENRVRTPLRAYICTLPDSRPVLQLPHPLTLPFSIKY
jgi:hypothetical protein